MRKKFRNEIEELKQDVERLEKKLDDKSDALFEQRKLIDFLLEHDRNDVVITNAGGVVFWNCSDYHNEIEISYLSHIAIKRVKIDTLNCHKVDIITNDEDRIIIKATNEQNPAEFAYYRIIKYSGEVADVTEYYQTPTTDDKADTPTKTDFKYFTAEQVRNMSPKEVKENYSDIMKSMKLWN